MRIPFISPPGRASAGHRVACFLLAGCCLLGPTGAAAQTTAALTDISVEDLMQVEVTSVSKKERPLGTSPAAVYVLTNEDIRRSGMTSVPELLRLIPGLHVARIDGSKWAISARGFNGRFANKLLVLVDGRTIYTPLYSGVYWDELDLPLGDIERIEVIRGPGGTMWGANAVNGVINVITREAGATSGTSVVLATGTEDRLSTTIRHGGVAGDRLAWRIWGKAFDRAPLALPEGGAAHDGWRMGRSGGRADIRLSEADTLTVQGDLYTGRENQTVAVLTLQPPYAEPFEERAAVVGRNVLARWTRSASPAAETRLQVFADFSSRRERLLEQDRRTLDVEFQDRRAVGRRHDLVWGLGYRQGGLSLTNGPGVSFADSDPSHRLVSVFAEDEIALAPDRFALTLGAKVEHNSYTGVELQPTVRALWSLTPRDALWAAVSRGVRTPSVFEYGATVEAAVFPGPDGLPVLATVTGGGRTRPEELWAAEAGYRWHRGAVSVDLSLFRNQYRHLFSLTPGQPSFEQAAVPFLRMPFLVDDAMYGHAYGVEANSTWRVRPRWTLTAGYAHLRVALTSDGLERDLRTEAVEDDTPRHQLVLRSLVSLGERWETDAAVMALGSADRGQFDAYTRVDLRLGWKATSALTVSLGGQNLLDARHVEFGRHLNEELTAPRRALLLQTAWTF